MRRPAKPAPVKSLRPTPAPPNPFTLGTAALFALFIAALSLGVFVVPWHVPSRHPTFSPSYIYGFNNFAAWICVALLLALLTSYRLFLKGTQEPTKLEAGLSAILPDGS